jgi:ABC-type nitrate/sulfonate/bicarbonate transport system substrate-binding protein
VTETHWEERELTRAAFLRKTAGVGLALGVGAALPHAAFGARSLRRRHTATKITVVAEWLPWAAHAPVFTAMNLGYFDDAGLDVNYIAPPHSGDQMKFVAGGRAQIALTQTPDVIRARAQGIPVKIIGQLWSGEPGGILALPDSGIKTPKDLVGKTLGLGQTPDHIGGFQTIMKTTKADSSKVKTVDKGYAGVQLLMDGKVDAISSVIGGEYSVVREQIKKKPNFIYYRDHGVPDYPLLVWFASESYLSDNPQVINGFLTAVQNGAVAAKANKPALTGAMKAIAKANNVFTPAQHQACLEDVRPYFTTKTKVQPAIVTKTGKWMQTVLVNGKPWVTANQVKPASEYLA